jgi:alkylresorcinol/alkylpyrone synthase
MSLPQILATATAVPELRVDQDTARDLAREGFEIAYIMESLFANSGVDTRHSSVPLEWFTQNHNWPERMSQYCVSALDLMEKVTNQALDGAGLEIEDIDMLLTVSTTGIVVPSLDAQLIERMPFRRDIDRLPIFGYGCAGGVMGVRRAADMSLAKPGQTILVLVVELSSVNFRITDPSATNFVSSALFGDGAAGVIIRHDPEDKSLNGNGKNWPTARVGASAVHSWNDTLDMMGFAVEEEGFGIVLSAAIPEVAATKMADPVLAFLEREQLSLDDIDGHVCHPGGPKVLDGIATSLGLTESDISLPREVLRNYGNMSAATVLFVLDQALRGGTKGRYLMTAFGPGFTLVMQLLEVE